jgi:hypothetical protein
MQQRRVKISLYKERKIESRPTIQKTEKLLINGVKCGNLSETISI